MGEKRLCKKLQGEYVETRCLGNERFGSSDEYCVKERKEEKRKQRNIMGRFIASWGFRGSVSSFPLHLPLLSSFLLSLSLSLSNFRPKTRSERFASLCTVQPPLVRIIVRFWETAHLPLPQTNIKTYFSDRAKC